MFSGIVEELADVVSFERVGSGAKLTVKSGLNHSETKLGDSICINGVCLTVIDQSEGQLSFELAEETLRRSSLGDLVAGGLVNLERSLQVGDRISGHFVFGHVDGEAELVARVKEGNSERYTWRVSPDLLPFIAEKGSISLSGVSLTVGEVTSEGFSVYIIPHTADVTLLGSMKPGGVVNVEVDMLARYVANLLSHNSGTSSITPGFLKEHGFSDG